jgi:hypothetical protein
MYFSIGFGFGFRFAGLFNLLLFWRFIHDEFNPATINAWSSISDAQIFTKTINVANQEVCALHVVVFFMTFYLLECIMHVLCLLVY